MSETGIVRADQQSGYLVGVDDAVSPAKLLQQIELIQNVMRSVMTEGEHYGVIPGTDKRCVDCDGSGKVNGEPCKKCKGTGKTGKPTLLKPGAEKLGFVFRHRPEFDIAVVEIPHAVPGHREYRLKCRLFSITTGLPVGEGVGSASTLETKWRFRTGPKELTDKAVPKEYWDNRNSDPKKAQDAIGGKGFSVGKGDDGRWYIAKVGEKVENDNPADIYNTALKIAKKRAHVDAELTATAASDLFTQDLDELVENEVIATTEKPAPSSPGAATEPGKPPAPAPDPSVFDHVNPNDLSDQNNEVAYRDHLFSICEQITIEEQKQDGGVKRNPSAVIYELTVKDGKYGKTSTQDIPWASRDGKLSPLKLAIKKAEARLEALAKVSDNPMPE